MARGTAVGEKVISQANTKAYEENYDASGLGKSERSRERGRWVWDPSQQKLVRPWEYDPGNTEQAKNALISTDRYYENTATTGGVDISSRRKFKEYLHRTGFTHMSDYDSPGGEWDRAAKARAEGFSSAQQKKERRARLEHDLGRAIEMPQARYEKEKAQRDKERARRGTAEPTK